jgi:hypothetical protein
MAADKNCRDIIMKLEAFGCNHILSTHSALDVITSKTALPKAPKTQNELMVWCFEHVYHDVEAKRLDASATNNELAIAVARHLLARRVVQFFVSRFKGIDDPAVTYVPGRAPSVVMKSVFSSLASFKASGLDKSSAHSMTWMSALPDYMVPILDFLAKLMRGHVQLNSLLDMAVRADATISADGFIRKYSSDRGGLAELFNLEEATKAHADALHAAKRLADPVDVEAMAAPGETEALGEELHQDGGVEDEVVVQEMDESALPDVEAVFQVIISVKTWTIVGCTIVRQHNSICFWNLELL